MTLGVTPERLEYLSFTLGCTPLPGALFSKAGTQIELAEARFAVEHEFMAKSWLQRQFPKARILTVETTGDALRAVRDGQADYYLGSLLEATNWLGREPVADVQVNRMLNYGTGYYHFAVRKELAPLAAILNKGIQSLRSAAPEQLKAALGQLPSDARWPKLVSTNEAQDKVLVKHPVWRVGAVRGLALLNEVDERGIHSGIAAEYTEQVAQRLGVAVEVVPFDSVASMLDGLRQGRIDLVPFLTRTASRSLEFDYSAPYVEMPYMLVARTDALHYWNLDSLRGRSLALAAQHPLREVLAASYPDIRVVESDSGAAAMDKVIRREADAAVEVKLFANLRINAPEGEQLRVVSEVHELPAQFHFATRKGGPALLPLVNAALAEIDPGERLRMLRRWVAVDFKPAFPWRRYAPTMALAVLALMTLGLGTWWWMVRLQREVLARRRSDQLLTDIATTVPGLAFRYILGPGGALRHNFFTPGAKAFLGRDLDPRSTVLTSLAPHMPPEDHAMALAEQERCRATGDRFRVTSRYHAPDGSTRWLHAEAVQTRSRDRQTVWTGFVVDVSTQHQLQQRLAQEAQSRSLMLASASHELRAPTHTLSLALQSLSPEGLDDEQRKAVQLAQDSAHTLSELLNDVLDAARSGQEGLRLRPRTFDLHQLLEDLGRAWRTAARTQGLGFEMRVEPDVPRTLQTDPLRLKQVLINLLSNACKYTLKGQVCLGARRSEEGELCIEVVDTGIGIDAVARERLFEPFATLDDPRAEVGAHGSTGLGLAISRRLAQLLGGRIELHSGPIGGTRAALILPWPNSNPSGSSATGEPEVAQSTSGFVAICDDDETSRVLLVLMLRRHGYETMDTSDCTRVLALWRQGLVRALITDLDMPGMSGFELIRIVREEERGRAPRLPVMVCSGSPVPDVDGNNAESGHDAYFVKPVEVSTLARTLRELGVEPTRRAETPAP
jgi:two-component system sensor histidine kinase EvgS